MKKAGTSSLFGGSDFQEIIRKAKKIVSTRPKNSEEYKEAKKLLKTTELTEKRAKQKESTPVPMETDQSSDSEVSSDGEDDAPEPTCSKGKKVDFSKGLFGSSSDELEAAEPAGSSQKRLKLKEKPGAEEKVYFWKVSKEACTPKKATPLSVGYDLVALEGKVIKPKDTALIDTGIKISLPKGTYGRIASRSGLALRDKVIVAGGVIDPDYDGTIKVILLNVGQRSYEVKKNHRIAQIIIEKVWDGAVEDLKVVTELGALKKSTERGEKGFGSSGY